MLEVDQVDWHLLENGKAHHTDRYEMLHVESTPILRRAQPFKLTISFKNRQFNEEKDKIRLLFKYDSKKAEPRIESLKENTNVSSSNAITNSKNEWSLQLVGIHDKSITVLVRSPPTAAWGTWKLSLKIGEKLDPKIETWNCPTAFWILFNPWSKDDDTYMPETKYLDEYILCDVGKVYTKGVGKPIGMKWIYGQFALPVLKVIKQIMNLMVRSEEELGSVVEMVKRLSFVGHTIIEGRWSDNYEGGTKPWLWTGSLPIFEEYLETGEKAKFAQCFVYGGILTTVLRAVGIPGRNVTNFVSSTSGYQTMSVNFVYDSSGEAIKEPKIWNFHVWNDAWMARYDLPLGYGGWQAVDTGLGPAPVAAIKKGEICQPFNARFIFTECNADRARWTQDDEGEHRLISVDPSFVGRAMLTKQPFVYDPHGDTDFMDLISEYKEPEGSREERMAVYNAMKYCKKINADKVKFFLEEFGETIPMPAALFTLDIPLEETSISFKLDEIQTVLFGQTLKAVLTIENNGETPATIESCIGCTSIYYNSAPAGLIKKERMTTTVPPNSKRDIILAIEPEQYAAKLVEFTLINVHCIATVKETNYTWGNDYQLHVDMPEMVITAQEDLIENKDGILLFQFKNCLKTKLTKCFITFEAPGIGRNVTFSCRDINPGENVIIDHKVKPTKAGEVLIKANFTSKEFNFLAGSAVLDVLQ